MRKVEWREVFLAMLLTAIRSCALFNELFVLFPLSLSTDLLPMVP